MRLDGLGEIAGNAPSSMQRVPEWAPSLTHTTHSELHILAQHPPPLCSVAWHTESWWSGLGGTVMVVVLLVVMVSSG